MRIFAALMLAWAVPAAAQLTVERAAPTVRTHTFDRARPPAALPPLEGSSAVTEARFDFAADIDVAVVDEEMGNGRGSEEVRTRIRIEEIAVRLGLGLDIWLPQGAGAELRAHEDGHRHLYELAYRRATDFDSWAERFLGRELEGEGASPQAARRAALEPVFAQLSKYYDEVAQDRSAPAHRFFDELTDSRRDPKVRADRAVVLAAAHFERVAAAAAAATESPGAR